MGDNQIMSEYGNILVIVDRDKMLAKKRRIQIEQTFNYKGINFLVHKPLRGKGWVVSEERTGSVASVKVMGKSKVAKPSDAHKTIKEAIKQTKNNIDKFISDGRDFDEHISKFMITVVTQGTKYIDLKNRNIL